MGAPSGGKPFRFVARIQTGDYGFRLRNPSGRDGLLRVVKAPALVAIFDAYYDF